MKFRKQLVCAMLTGCVATTVLSPSAFAGDFFCGYDEQHEHMPVYSSDYILEKESIYELDSNESKLVGYAIYDNDLNGKVTKKTEYYFGEDNQPVLGNWETYAYDSNGWISEKKYYFAEGNRFYGAATYTRDSKGNIITEDIIDNDSEDEPFKNQYTYTYDDHNNITSKTESSFSEYINNRKNIYDENGNLIKIESDGDIIKTYQYDSNNRIVKIFSENSGDSFLREEFSYDDNGNEATYTYHDNEVMGTRYVYEYKKVSNSEPTPAPTPTPDPTPSTPTFTDVPAGQFYTDAVKWAAEKGITVGTSDTTFSPNAVCNREQIVTFLWRANGSQEPKSTSCPFTDVKPSDFAYKAILWAVENGITYGTSNTTFEPKNGCSRAEVVTFQWRANGKPDSTASNVFSDVSTNAYYTDAVAWAVKNGITYGTGKTTFSPHNICSRGEIVTFLYRDLA